jgi:response regulator RpfG family c-di-GMP phosphodiesterase
MLEDELAIYYRHLEASLELLLSKKLAIVERTRNVLLAVHERADATGFPKNLPGKKIPFESEVIHFCKELDRRTMVRMGKAKMSVPAAQAEILGEEDDTSQRFTPRFLAAIKTTVKAAA